MPARVTADGRVTIPTEVRNALGIATGDQVVFQVDGAQAVMARSTDLLDSAGTVDVPAAKRRAPRDVARDIVRRTRTERRP